MGGRKNWDDTRYITWRFIGFRLHVWDKWTGDLRFEQGEMTVLMNIRFHAARNSFSGAFSNRESQYDRSKLSSPVKKRHILMRLTTSNRTSLPYQW